jgi:outer membrane protein OmpA-like peptidoglycan-associated protein
MFEELVTTLEQKYGLGTQARPFVQMLLARISDPMHGGFSGFLQRLRIAAAVPISAPEIERVVGDTHLISDMTSRFGIDRTRLTAALGYAIPAVVARVARGGVAPVALPPEAEAFIGNRGAWAAAAPVAAAQAGAVQAPTKNWLPWIAVAVIALLTLGYCSTQKRSEPVETTTAPVVAPPAAAPQAPPPPVPELALVEPEGAAVIAAVAEGIPVLKVYFDVGKAVVADEFQDKSAAIIEYMKANPDKKAVIAGFNDPTGDAAANARLAKSRAEAVQQKLVAAGIAKERTLLEKPPETTGTAPTNAASRRVDVMLR